MSPPVSTVYPIEISNSCGTARDTIKVNVVDTPSLIARTDTSICLGSSILLTATSNFPIRWYPMNTLGASITMTPIINTSYYAEVNTSCGIKRDTVNISILQVPNLSVTNDTSICNGNNIALKAKSTVSPFWNNQGISDTIMNVSPSINTIYPVQASNICGVIKDTILVTVLNKPIINILSDSLLTCINNNVILMANSTHTVNWKPNGTVGNHDTIVASTTTKYYAESQNSCGKVSDSILLVVETAPPVIVTSRDTIICRGQSTPLSVIANGTIYWNELSTSANKVNVSPTNSTNYTIQANNVCGISRDTLKVTVDSVLNLYVSNDTSVCVGSLAKLNHVNGINIQWTPPGISTNTIHYVIVNSATTYYASAINACGLYHDSVRLSVQNRPVVYGGRDTIVCPGSPVVLKALSDENVTWLGFSAGNQVTINPFVSKLHIATSTNQCGTSLDTVQIDVFPLPKAIANGTINDKVVSFSNTSSNASSYKWYFGDGDTSSVIKPVHTYIQYGNYTIILVASNQCGFDTTTMIVILKSNSSIQNSQNNHVKVYPNPVKSLLNIEFISPPNEMTIKIYDVMGRLVIQKMLTKNDSPIINFSELSQGNYMLIIEENDQNHRYKITKE